MPLIFNISPALLLPWVSPEDRKNNVILMDVEFDVLDQNEVRLDLNIVFKPVRVRRGFITRADYYVASTGAEIAVDSSEGQVRQFTQAQTLSANYKNTSSHTRKSAITISPTIKAKDKVTELEADLGSIALESGAAREFSATYVGSERSLTPIAMKDSIHWSMTLPRGEHVVQDFISGNVYLFAVVAWDSVRKGRIAVRPSDISFFDRDRRLMDSRSSIRMLYSLWRNGLRMRNRDGFSVEFEEAT